MTAEYGLSSVDWFHFTCVISALLNYFFKLSAFWDSYWCWLVVAGFRHCLICISSSQVVAWCLHRNFICQFVFILVFLTSDYIGWYSDLLPPSLASHFSVSIFRDFFSLVLPPKRMLLIQLCWLFIFRSFRRFSSYCPWCNLSVRLVRNIAAYVFDHPFDRLSV